MTSTRTEVVTGGQVFHDLQAPVTSLFTRVAHARVVLDLLLWETLKATALDWSLRKFERVVLSALAIASLLTATASSLATAVLLSLRSISVTPAQLTIAWIILLVGTSGADLLRSIFDANKYDAPGGRVRVLRSLDVDGTTYALVYSIGPRIPQMVVFLSAATGIFICMLLNGESAAVLSSLILLAVTPLLILTPALTSLVNIRARRIATPAWALLAVSLGMAFTTGALSSALGSNSDMWDARLGLGRSLSSASDVFVRVALVTLGAVAVGACLWSWRVVRRRQLLPMVLDVRAEQTRRRARNPSIGRLTNRSGLVGILLREFVRSDYRREPGRIFLGSLYLLCLVAGWRVAYPSATVHPLLLSTVTTITLITTISAGENIIRLMGVSRFAKPLRVLYETGYSAGRLAGDALLAYISAAASILIPAFVTLSLLNPGYLATFPAVVALLAAASIVSETLVPSVRSIDGGVTTNTMAGIAVIFLMSPLALLVAHGPSGLVVASVSIYALVLSGGALKCLSYRMQVMASSFAA